MISRLLCSLFDGRIKGMPPLDESKVLAYLATLNAGRLDNPLWIATNGIFAPIGMDVTEDSRISFNANFGYPIKIFKNVETSELKILDARFFSRSTK